MPFNKFEPTDEQRQTVQLMAAVNRPLDEIAAKITNSVTGKPITRNTLSKLFAPEIKNGKSTLLVPALQQLKKKIDDGERWAVELGLRVSGVPVDGNAASITDASVHNKVINIVGIAPSPKPGELPPPRPYDPRPLPKWPESLRDELSSHPHCIEAEAAPSPPKPEPQLYTHTPLIGKPWIGPK